MPGHNSVQYILNRNWRGLFVVLMRTTVTDASPGTFRWGRWRKLTPGAEGTIQNELYGLNKLAKSKGKDFRFALRRSYSGAAVLMVSNRTYKWPGIDAWSRFKPAPLSATPLVNTILRNISSDGIE